MPFTNFETIKPLNIATDVSELCRLALQKLDASSHFRVRILLEMAIIQLALDDPDSQQPERRLDPTDERA